MRPDLTFICLLDLFQNVDGQPMVVARVSKRSDWGLSQDPQDPSKSETLSSPHPITTTIHQGNVQPSSLLGPFEVIHLSSQPDNLLPAT